MNAALLILGLGSLLGCMAVGIFIYRQWQKTKGILDWGCRKKLPKGFCTDNYKRR